jgi:hypothetical protein
MRMFQGHGVMVELIWSFCLLTYQKASYENVSRQATDSYSSYLNNFSLYVFLVPKFYYMMLLM